MQNGHVSSKKNSQRGSRIKFTFGAFEMRSDLNLLIPFGWVLFCCNDVDLGIFQ